MKRIIHVVILSLLTLSTLHAQKKLVLLDPQNRKINQGEALPAQSSFDIQVPVNEATGIIYINIFKGSDKNDVIQRIFWARPVNFTGDFAELPVDVRFRNNRTYGFDVSMYAILSDSEHVKLQQIVRRSLHNYLNATLQARQDEIDLAKEPDDVLEDLNAVVRKSLTYYRNTRQREFEGFSDIVRLKIRQVQKTRLSDAALNLEKAAADSAWTEEEEKAAYSRELSSELEQIVFDEVDNYLNLDFVQLSDSFVIANRPTEKSQTVLPLFVGYGGVHLGGDLDDLEYDSQPYAGLSFPIGRGNESHFGRTSFIVGVFLRNFKDGEGKTVTGPIVDRPVFTGLGFRIYDFINFNAGVVATSTEKQSLSDFKTEDIQLRAFIGLNLQFNLWLGLNKK